MVKRTRMMLIAMVAAGLSAYPVGATNDSTDDTGKQWVNAHDLAKQRINSIKGAG